MRLAFLILEVNTYRCLGLCLTLQTTVRKPLIPDHDVIIFRFGYDACCGIILKVFHAFIAT
jgi:hypothetical protein